MYRGVLLPQNHEIYTPNNFESWTEDLNVAENFAFHYLKTKTWKQGVVLKRKINKENIFTTYFLNDYWKILDKNDWNQKEYIVCNLQPFQLTKDNCLKSRKD